MNQALNSKPTQPIWISHRGLCQNADENTLASFNAAVKAKFHYLETDLRATKDNHIVLCHDQTLSRTSALEIDVTTKTRAELGNVTLTKGSPLLFLDQFTAEFGHLGHVFDIKIETGFKVIELLGEFDINLKKTIFLCWSTQQQQALLERYPDANCFAREEECTRAGFSVLLKMPFLGGIQAAKTYSVTPYFKGFPVLKQNLVARYHRYGAKVLAYLPESMEEAQMALDANADYVLSNHDFKLI
jgi:glycerophosphoryl diester phosphodiesterase